MSKVFTGQGAKKLKQFLSIALAFTTTISLSGFALMFAFTASAQVMSLSDGDLVKGPDGIKVYIVKPSAHGSYTGWKRHIFNPAVFNMYGHLSWSNIKSVNQATIDAYQTSDLYRAFGDPKVYSMQEMGDSALKNWIQDEAAFNAHGYSWDQIFTVNDSEKNYYAEGAAITAGSTTTTTTTTTPTTTTTTTTTTTVPAGTGLTVALASDTPGATSVIADTTSGDGAQALASMLKVNFMAGSDGDVKVTTLKIKRLGISADADLANVYLYDGATRVAEMTNISSNYITFTNASGLFTVTKGTTKGITVKADVTNGTSSGKTVALSVNTAADVVAGGAAVSGSFPITGSTMTTATISDLGKATFANVTPAGATTVDPGQTGYEVWKFSLASADQDVKLYSIKITNVGSIATTDVTNLKLKDSGTQLGATASSLNTDGTVTFDLSANPFKVIAGQTKNLSLVADVIGGTTRTYRFSIQRSSDITVMDDNYGVSIKPNQTDSFSIVQAGGATTINSGTLTIAVDSASPNGNVAKDYTDQELARFSFKASGEAVKVSSLPVTVTTTGSGGLNNAKLYLDGTQVGSTTDIPTSTAATFTFGNSFIVPAGATKTLVIKAEVKKADGTSFTAADNIQVLLGTGSSNAQGQTSLTSISTSAANANTLTVQSGQLTVTANSGLANATASLPTGVKGATSAKIGSFVITAGSGEGVEVSQMVVKNSATAGYALGNDFQNLTLKNGSTQIGTTVSSLSTAASNTYTFTPSPAITINAGQQYVVDVYADILTGASNATTTPTAYVAVIFDNVSATGKSTSADASYATDVNGQNVALAVSGALTIAAASDMPIAQNRAMGEVGQTLATFKLTTGAQEAVNISKLVVTDTITGTAATGTITNLKLFNSSGVQVGPTVASIAADGTATFDGLTYSLAKDKSEVLTLKGDMNSYPNGVSGSTHTFSVAAAADVTTTGATSGQAIAETISSASGNAQRAYRAELTIANAMSNFSGGQGTGQVVGKYRFTNTSAGNYTITVTDIDLGISSTLGTTAATRTVTLKRDSTNGTTLATKSVIASASGFSDITSWDSTMSSFSIDASSGTGYVDVYVLIDTNDAASTEAISTSLNTGSNVVTWGDGVTSSVTTLDNTPINGATVTY